MSRDKVFVCLTTLLAAYASPTPANAITITDGIALVQLFTANNFQAPAVNITDNEQLFILSVQGKAVDHTIFDDSGGFTTDFAFNFWRGSMTFSVIDGFINVDSVTRAMTIRHQAGIDRPHTGDDLMGTTYTLGSSTVIADTATGSRTLPTGPIEVDHPHSGHKDFYSSSLTVSSAPGSSNITGWTFEFRGTHPDSVPGVPDAGNGFVLLGGGMLIIASLHSLVRRRQATPRGTRSPGTHRTALRSARFE
jgi:hypothetical protein